MTKIKLSNIWSNFDDFIRGCQDSIPLPVMVNNDGELVNGYTWRSLVDEILRIFSNTENINALRWIFDYTDEEILKIRSLIKDVETTSQIADKLMVELDGQVYMAVVFGSEITNQKNFNPKDYKITSEVQDNGRGRSKVHNFYCNGIKILTWTDSFDSYCTITGGVPSNIRNKTKPARDLSWNRDGLMQLFNPATPISLGGKSMRGNSPFRDDYPDTTWGYTGPSKPTNKSILNTLQDYVLNYKN